jgi:hypothetical protein
VGIDVGENQKKKNRNKERKRPPTSPQEAAPNNCVARMQVIFWTRC